MSVTTGNLLDGVESSAAKLLVRAIALEQESKFQPALVCYQEGIDLLMDVSKKCKEQEKKQHYRERLEEYMTRAEKIKKIVLNLKESGKYHDQIKIEENSTGYAYARVFGPYLDETLTEVIVKDAYIQNFHQINNFLRFCELLVIQCTKIKRIKLITKEDGNAVQQQKANLHSLATSLYSRDVTLDVEYSESLHDREIRLSNGWIIKIGRGLDYFQKANKFHLGFHDMNLRECRATTVDVFHINHTRDR